MKIKPEIYAEALIAGTKEKQKDIAAKFWHVLQKNKQYKDLPRILDALDQVYADQNQSVLAKVYSENNLSDGELSEIKSKLKAKFKKEIMVKNILKKNLVGYTVKINDNLIDLSLNGKVESLKKLLSTNP